MEPVSAVLGVMAALPQCVQSAKQLYDLRSRYKDASVLISAIYSESMVIAASLSQVQILLQNAALQSKPQLLQTFDSALTGCRVVYGCLEEEVRELVAKTENDDLRFKDRAKFLWKEATFKELLTQIRGQQSALSLLIQGLQMESIADIRRLVTENSATLDQVVKRSKTLRQSHPRVRVPESVFRHENLADEAVDADSILQATEFTFDEEVVNSKAYRRAMALYSSQTKAKTPQTSEEAETMDDPPAYDSRKSQGSEAKHICPDSVDHKSGENDPDTQAAGKSPIGFESFESGSKDDGKNNSKDDDQENSSDDGEDDSRDDGKDNCSDLFESIERDYLPFMPQITTRSIKQDVTTEEKSPHITAHTEKDPQSLLVEEEAPPLPPRRPTELKAPMENRVNSQPEVRSSNSSITTLDATSILSRVSTSSSQTMYGSMTYSMNATRKTLRRPLLLAHQVSQDLLSISDVATDVEPPGFAFQNVEMHDIWHSLLREEKSFVERMKNFRKMFFDNVVKHWPLLEDHLEAILVGEQLANLHQECLLSTIEQINGVEGAVCDPLVFEAWANKAHRLYREYCQRMPHAVSSLRTTHVLDPKFQPFVHTVGLSIAWFGKSWEDYLMLPTVQLGLYVSTLENLIQTGELTNDPASCLQTTRLRRSLECVQWLKALCDTTLDEAQNREDIQNLEKKIHTLDSAIFSRIRLLDSNRRVKHQGGMAIKLKSHGAWVAVHVMLLDNYLLWGKVKPQKKPIGDRIIVMDAPIAVESLDIEQSDQQNHFERATIFDEIPRGTIVYTIIIKDINQAKSHMLGAFDYKEHKKWLESLNAAISLIS